MTVLAVDPRQGPAPEGTRDKGQAVQTDSGFALASPHYANLKPSGADIQSHQDVGFSSYMLQVW